MTVLESRLPTSAISLPKRASLLSAADQPRSLNAPLETTCDDTDLSQVVIVLVP
jgi:hypothetical protein